MLLFDFRFIRSVLEPAEKVGDLAFFLVCVAYLKKYKDFFKLKKCQ